MGLLRSRRIVAILAVVAIASSGCGSDRPSVAEWQPVWDEITAAIPDEAAVVEGLSVATCGETLAFLRSNRARLNPTPDLAIDDTVTAWIEIAEDAFFECPPDNDQVHDFAEAYDELVRLQAEIDIVLQMDR